MPNYFQIDERLVVPDWAVIPLSAGSSIETPRSENAAILILIPY